MKITTEAFIAECKETHNNFYDYAKTLYSTTKGKVLVTCPIHGDFEIIAYNHKKGQGCPKCGRIKSEKAKKYTEKEFIEKANKKHNYKYDLSKVNYVDSQTKIEVVCKKHGSFFITPANFLQGRGCTKCAYDKKAVKKRITRQEHLKRFKQAHNNTYDYSLSVFKNSQTKIDIICKKHGVFKQTPAIHANGHGCPKCAIEKPSNYITKDQFEKKANIIHNNFYSYEGLEYTEAKNKVGVVCPKHGYFEQTANAHLSGKGCSKCGNLISRGEAEIFDFLKNNNLNVKNSDREIIAPQEVDILCKENKIAIEYNGVYYHSDNFLEDNYHITKTESCEERGYQLIHIFSDEWITKKEIVKSRLLNLMNKTPHRIYARKCEVKEVSTKEAMTFLEDSHIQGRLGAKIKIGLYYNDKLVSLMTFGGLRKNLGSSKKEGHYELLRFCNSLNTTVVGGASKLFKYFIRNYKVKSVISYADRRWSNGNLYEKLGFNLVSKTKPNYFYTKGHYRENRFKYRKSEIIKSEKDKQKTEKEIMKERGYYRIYDCGTLKYELINY